MNSMHEDTYPMSLIPRSLRGKAMQWSTKWTPPLKKFGKLAQHFIQQYSYNIQYHVTMFGFCSIKKKQGKPFTTYLERWRSPHSRYPQQVPEIEKIHIFVNKIVPKIFFDLIKKLFTSFNAMVENAYHIEDVAIIKGDIILNKGKNGNGNDKDKNKPWNKNK